MNGLGKIFLALLIACFVVLGVLAFCRHTAHAQAIEGQYNSCTAGWSSREVIWHQGTQYMPLTETGPAMVCLDSHGYLYVMAHSGNPAAPTMLHVDTLPVVW